MKAVQTIDAEATAVLTAKLRMPELRPETIARGRVRRILASAGEHPLTVLCAPAGYGKTTALVEWLSTTEDDVAWLSLDAADNDPRRLWTHLLAALDDVIPGGTTDAAPATTGGPPATAAVVSLVTQTLAEQLAGRLVIVLDDYHLVTDAACHQLVAALLNGLSPAVRLVIASRSRPPLNLARRRAAGTAIEIGGDALAFRAAESELLLNGSLGLDLHADQIAAIDERVEGWAAGLSLVAASLAGRSHRDEFLESVTRARTDLAEYLVEEVLDALDPRMRDFLCRTSILDRLCAPLCVAVLDDPSAHELFAEAQRSNLFVTAAVGDGTWLRYHHLMAAHLQRDLGERSPALIPTLHRRAASWYEAKGMPDEAIQHAIAAGDGERAAEVLHGTWRRFVVERPVRTIRETIRRMPTDRGRFAEFCRALDALCMMGDGTDPRLVAQRLDALTSAPASPGVAPIVDQLRISPYYGDVGRAVLDGWTAWRRYHAQPDLRAWVAAQMGAVLWFADDHDGVREVLEPMVDEIPHPAARATGLATLALCAVDHGDGDQADRYARAAVGLAASCRTASSLALYLPYIAHGEVLRRQGALTEAGEALGRAARATIGSPGSMQRALTLICQAQLQLAAHNRGCARANAAAARRIIDHYRDVGTLAGRLEAMEVALEGRGHGDLRGSEPTPAERRVLELLPSPLTLKAIAARLYVSPNTVTSHAQRLYRRLGVRSRGEAVVAARERGLL